MEGDQRLALGRVRPRFGAGQPGDGRAEYGLGLVRAIVVNEAVGKLPSRRCPGAWIFAEPQCLFQMLQSAYVVRQGFGPSELDKDVRSDAGRHRFGDGPAQVGRPGLRPDLPGSRRAEDVDSPRIACWRGIEQVHSHPGRGSPLLAQQSRGASVIACASAGRG